MRASSPARPVVIVVGLAVLAGGAGWLGALWGSRASDTDRRPTATIVDRTRPSLASRSEPTTAAVPGRPMVLVHSYTGHTRAVGQEIAHLLGGRFVSFATPPPGFPVPPRALPKVPSAASLQLNRAGVVYLGFPIWHLGPSWPMVALVKSLDLRGKAVVLFYTCLHGVSANRLQAFRALIRQRGGHVLETIGIQAPLFDGQRDLVALTRKVIYDRPELWMSRPDPAPRPDCHPAPKRPGTELCHITGGPVWVGIPQTRFAFPLPPRVRLLHVQPFEIDRTEETVGAYHRCVQSGHCPPLQPTLTRSQAQMDSRIGRHETAGIDPLCLPGKPDLPQPCVSYEMASDFCHWIGMRLPTLAEWTRAARGHTMNPYPWGSGWPGKPPHLSHAQERTPNETDPFAKAAWLSPGCSYPSGNSPFGVCDLAGSLAEYADPRGLPSTGKRVVVVGGAFLDSRAYAFRITSGILFPRSLGMYVNGFRCAK